MADQSTTAKVMRCVITPMTAFFSLKPMADEVVSAYVEELGQHSPETLEAAWRQVRRECKTPPKLAHFVEACQSNRPRSSQPARPNRWAPRGGVEKAEAVMRSPVGQQALRLGAGRCLWLEAFESGRTEFHDWDLRKYEGDCRESVRLLTEYPAKSSPVYAALEGLYRKMQAQEQHLAAKYLAA